ncbi:hypothetical protein CYMTET_23565 [Cymbomonas tetramitiformis]|uniref:EF-hand domain-containing protein n=1 Tax=Cymbomonas tetramitiformis TaxID=36881 RepID=A0AAE0L132_9CHLO|nr:hypothetical protein CYMTET_23565 [Cymbomonas tetramitiformis]
MYTPRSRPMKAAANALYKEPQQGCQEIPEKVLRRWRGVRRWLAMAASEFMVQGHGEDRWAHGVAFALRQLERIQTTLGTSATRALCVACAILAVVACLKRDTDGDGHVDLDDYVLLIDSNGDHHADFKNLGPELMEMLDHDQDGSIGGKDVRNAFAWWIAGGCMVVGAGLIMRGLFHLSRSYLQSCKRKELVHQLTRHAEVREILKMEFRPNPSRGPVILYRTGMEILAAIGKEIRRGFQASPIPMHSGRPNELEVVELDIELDKQLVAATSVLTLLLQQAWRRHFLFHKQLNRS